MEPFLWLDKSSNMSCPRGDLGSHCISGCFPDPARIQCYQTLRQQKWASNTEYDVPHPTKPESWGICSDTQLLGCLVTFESIVDKAHYFPDAHYISIDQASKEENFEIIFAVSWAGSETLRMWHKELLGYFKESFMLIKQRWRPMIRLDPEGYIFSGCRHPQLGFWPVLESGQHHWPPGGLRQEASPSFKAWLDFRVNSYLSL